MIAAISNANGTSGFEDEVVAAIRPYAEGLGEITEDCMRNLYIRRKENNGKRPVVQLDAHSDEVGFMVQAICPNGTLRIIQIGGWVNHNIPAHKVLVRNRFGEYIPGITASKPPHFMTVQERKAPLDMKDITVDVGAVSKEEAVEKFGIRIGEPVVPDVTFTYSETTDLMVGKSFDCRLGCAAILKTMHTLAGQELNVDIVGACAAQEEVGVRGATVTAQVIKPDIAIVFEGCPADDTCVEPYMVQTAIKRGPMLRHIDARMITNPRYQRYALDLAEKLPPPLRGRPSRQSKLFPISPQASLRPDAAGKQYMLSIVTTDRLGLLASIARVFVKYGINLVTARITTLGERAEDVFLIESAKLRDPVFCAEFEKAVLEALEL